MELLALDFLFRDKHFFTFPSVVSIINIPSFAQSESRQNMQVPTWKLEPASSPGERGGWAEDSETEWGDWHHLPSIFPVDCYQRNLSICTQLHDDLKWMDPCISLEVSLKKSCFLFMKIHGFLWLAGEKKWTWAYEPKWWNTICKDSFST